MHAAFEARLVPAFDTFTISYKRPAVCAHHPFSLFPFPAPQACLRKNRHPVGNFAITRDIWHDEYENRCEDHLPSPQVQDRPATITVTQLERRYARSQVARVFQVTERIPRMRETRAGEWVELFSSQLHITRDRHHHPCQSLGQIRYDLDP